MDDLARSCCQNLDWIAYGQRNAGNRSVCGRIGKQKQIRRLYRKGCRRRPPERKGTPLCRSHLPEPTAVSILEHLAEGGSIRQTGRLVGVHRDTVVRLARAAGQHAHDAHEELVAFPPRTREIQPDERWSFVHAKQEDCDLADAQKGGLVGPCGL